MASLNFSEEQLSYLLNHLFLHRKLLQKSDEPTITLEGVVLVLLTHETEQLTTELQNELDISNVTETMQLWTTLQQEYKANSGVLHDCINQLVHGKFMALYVREQNTTLVIERLESSAVVSWFQASVNSKCVNATVGDLAAWLPSGAVSVPRLGILQSKVLSENLADLCNCVNEDCVAQSCKAGTQFKEVREVSKPVVVSNWLLAILCGDGSVQTSMHQVQKKIRDEVLWNRTLLPFRRSGLYFSAKVVLHLRLNALLGQVNGTIAYKLLLLRTLNTVCKLWWQQRKKKTDYAYNNADLAMQLLAKLARRSHKLEQLCGEESSLHSAVQSALEAVASSVQSIRLELDEAWKRVVESSRSKTEELSVLDLFSVDLEQSLSSAKPKINDLVSLIDDQSSCTTLKNSGERNLDICCLPNVQLLDTNDDMELGLALMDIEKWWQAQKLDTSTPKFAVKDYHRLHYEYLNKAAGYYENDPIGWSRMVLAAMRAVIEMDRVASKAHPMLLQHNFGANTKALEYLLLPAREDLQYMYEIRDYVAQRNARAQFETSLLKSNPCKANAVGVRYAKADQHMLSVLREILRYAEVQKEKKLAEVREKKNEYEKLMREARSLTCSYKEKYIKRRNNRVLKNVHRKNCQKCKIERQAKQISINVYELPLPTCQDSQAAVVFELCLPDELAFLRDGLYRVHKTVLQNKTVHHKIVKKVWTQYEQLSCWNKSESLTVELVSTVKLVSKTHYLNLTLDQPDSYYIVENGMTVQFSPVVKPLVTSEDNLVEKLSFSVEDQYLSLQDTVGRYDHNENQTLCRQVQCAPNLSLSEFRVFGCLRAGHRTQLHNVLDALEARSLSFKERSVAALVLQAVYQVGPIQHAASITSFVNGEAEVPEAHELLRNPEFVSVFLDTLSGLLEEIANNWRDHISLLIIVSLTARMLTLCPPEMEDRAAKVLLRCREISTAWEEKVAAVLTDAEKTEPAERLSLQRKLAIVAATTVLTFAIDQHHVLLSEESIPTWLRSNARIYENVYIGSSGAAEKAYNLEQRFLRNLLRQVRYSQVMCESAFFGLADSAETFENAYAGCLKQFLNAHWADGDKGSISNLKRSGWWVSCDFYQKAARVQTVGKKRTIEVSLDGQFLVDGLPVGRLPRDVQTHSTYTRVFEDRLFDVQPSASSATAMVAVLSNKQYVYSFQKVHAELLVTERNVKTCAESLLLPCTVFEGDLPEHLCTKYSHWLDRVQNVISFRPVLFSDGNFSTAIFYTLDLNTMLLRRSENEYLLDIKGACFTQLYASMFFRFELERYIHVFCDKRGEKAKVIIELPRYGLHFERTSTDVFCLDYQGMQVARCQKLGTLVGLKEGLLLVSQSDVNCASIFLVPHGQVQVAVDIRQVELEELRSPAFFAYSVDKRLRQLKAPHTDSAVLYLAYLHAITSFVLADPFTGLLGSERALQILQSAAVFSCKPYDTETLTTLDLIAKLSPMRTYYPPHVKSMQSIKWPKGVCSTQALEAYRMIVHSLKKNSLRTAFALNSNNDKRVVLVGTAATSADANTLNERNAKKEEPNDLNYRALWRSVQQYNRLSKDWLESLCHKPQTKSISVDKFTLPIPLDSVRLLSAYCTRPEHEYADYIALKDVNLADYLGGLLILHGVQAVESADYKRFDFLKVSEWLKQQADTETKVDLKQEWLRLCDYAMHCTSEEDVTRLVVHLSFHAYKQVSLTDLMPLLVTALERSSLMLDTPMPRHRRYHQTSEVTYSSDQVTDTVKRFGKGVDDYLRRNSLSRQENESISVFRRSVTSFYEIALNRDCEEIDRKLMLLWSTQNRRVVDRSLLVDTTEVGHELQVISSLNVLLNRWSINAELRLFLNRLSNALNGFGFSGSASCKLEHAHFESAATLEFHKYIESHTFRHLQLAVTNISQIHVPDEGVYFEKAESEQLQSQTANETESLLPTLPVNFEATSEAGNALLENLKDSWLHFHSAKRNTNVSVPLESEQLLPVLEERLATLEQQVSSAWEEVSKCLSASRPSHKALAAAGLWPSVVPSTALPCICATLNGLEVSDEVRKLVENFAVLTVYEQRVSRCLAYCRAGECARVQLERELRGAPHSGWSPCQQPEWLLFELENDLVIRPVQAEVANRLIEPKNKKNSVLQLNMGEGKTVVIVPIVVLALGDGSRLVRLTVLKPLLKMNMNALKHKLGWLLNRRVFYMPVSRDVDFNSENIQEFEKLLLQCKCERGVLVTLPEYRNSFKLKCFEKCKANRTSEAQRCLNLSKWLDENARDILDESDEILHVRFQLIYTIGHQQVVDGGQNRWKVSQAVLKLAATRLAEMHAASDENKKHVLFSRSSCGGSTAFPTVRLLTDQLYSELCRQICNDIVECRSDVPFVQLLESEKSLVKNVVLERDAEKYSQTLREVLNDDLVLLTTIRLLRGILSYGVLELVLSKRWRVNYGVNEQLVSSGMRAMAVPFRGKDMPSDRAEFGHTDVAIMLTVLSYYYSGLSDTQLDRVFEKLMLEANCGAVYSDLVKGLDLEKSASQYAGVHLEDVQQKKYLYKLLRFHPQVIDYFLNKTVFPKEAKAFPAKLVSSAWDLAETSTHLTTGFSGTNETKLLLPLTISQNDLPQLQETNGMMIANLLQTENDDYDWLELGSTGSGLSVLHRLISRKAEKEVRVLLDVGGLILDMDNRALVENWLRLTEARASEIAAALYFRSDDELFVLDRAGRDVRFDLSPHKNSLDKCVVYLDDAHTRGTDLRFPHGFRACVTLGKGVTKDRLVQACMRMRLLGHGHSVSFLASNDVHVHVVINTQTGDSKIGSRDVLNWALRNSNSFVEDSFVQWSNMAASYSRRLNAYENWKRDNDWKKLGESSTEKESIDLEETYGFQLAEVAVPIIAERNFNRAHKFLNETSLSRALDVKEQVLEKCKKYVATVRKLCSLLSEEQERELEHELEEESQVVRPGPSTAATPRLSEALRNFVTTGQSANLNATAFQLCAALEHTTLQNKAERGGWLTTLLVSDDFIKVLDDNALYAASKFDEFLRSPRWVLIREVGAPAFVMISQFEANQLFKEICRSKFVTLRLFSAIKRLNQRQFFNTDGVIVGVGLKKGTMERLVSTSGVSSRLLVELNVFGGSVYFTSVEDQEEWLGFLGLCPSQRSEHDQNLFDSGRIDRDGFVPPASRELLQNDALQRKCRFTKSPVAFARSLIELRNFHCVYVKSPAMTVLLEYKRYGN